MLPVAAGMGGSDFPSVAVVRKIHRPYFSL